VPSDIETPRSGLKPCGDIAARLGNPARERRELRPLQAKISLDYIQSLEGSDPSWFYALALGRLHLLRSCLDAHHKIRDRRIVCLAAWEYRQLGSLPSRL